MKIRILVTGGAGFIPSCLIDRLVLNPNYYVVAVDNFLTGHVDKISKSEFAAKLETEILRFFPLDTIATDHKNDKIKNALRKELINND